jgi:salicylate hydroxylase
MQKSVLVAGAGIGGLCAAVALARRGISVEVLEQTSVLAEVGAGVQMSPNAVKVLANLGLDKRVEAVAFEPDGGEMRHYKSGKTISYTPFKNACERRYGAKYYHVHRADLHKVLYDAALELGVSVRLDTKIASYDQSGGTVRAVSTDGRSFQGDVLVGADGIHSAVRAQMLGPDEAEFTGQIAWRAVIPVENLPPNLIRPNATVWIGPGRHVVTYYVRGGTLVNLAAFQDKDHWPSESWRAKGDINEFRNAFKGWHTEVGTLVEAASDCFVWALYAREPLSTWSEGHVTLLGDACHPMLPYMSQGAAMAIEDSYVLADRLSRKGMTIAQALMDYERCRKPRTSMVQAGSRKNGKLFHMSGGLRSWGRLTALRIAATLQGGTAHSRVDPLYEYDAAR